MINLEFWPKRNDIFRSDTILKKKKKKVNFVIATNVFDKINRLAIFDNALDKIN